MAVSTNKKVQVVRFDRAPVEGFVQLPDGLENGQLQWLTADGSLGESPIDQVKAICFIRDFGSDAEWRPNRVFTSRPKSAGLWLRLTFRDGDILEGILPNNLMLVEPQGFSVVPPNPTFQSQHIFVPREALTGVEVLGVIGSPLRRRAKKKKSEDEDQLQMFD